DIIELDFGNPEMRKAMINAMKFWVTEFAIDGFRCDLAFWVELDFWMEAIPQLNAIRPLFWLAESDALEHPDYMQVFDAAYTWTWQGIPLIYSGQELPNLKRLEFFEKDVIDWTEEHELHDFYKTLLNLHAINPALTANEPVKRLKTTAENEILAYSRKNDKD